VDRSTRRPSEKFPSGDQTDFSNINAAGVPTITSNRGVITTTATKSCEIQFGLKFVFWQ